MLWQEECAPQLKPTLFFADSILMDPTSPGKSFPLGATVHASGVNFSVCSKGVEGVELLSFNRADHPMSRLSWKGRKRSSVKITERTHEEATEALHAGREGRYSEAAFGGRSADLRSVCMLAGHQQEIQVDRNRELEAAREQRKNCHQRAA